MNRRLRLGPTKQTLPHTSGIQSLDVSQLSGFDAKAAEISANRNGFYLFHSTDS